MRVALFHNTYRFRGGEDVVVDAEESILRALGAEVFRLEVHNDEVFDPPRLRAVHDLAASSFNRARAGQVGRFLKQHRCDIGHVHNWFPLFSPSIYSGHQRAGVPAIQTLHNYRVGCAAGTLTREGEHCRLCLDGDRSNAVRYRCYRDSGLLTRMWARVIDRGWQTGNLHRLVSRFIAPTEYVARIHGELGLPRDKIEVLPHGVPDRGPTVSPGRGALFVGRLSQEKGVDTLLRAWRSLSVPLTIVGTGPLEDLVQREAEASAFITHAGACSPEEVAEHMDRAAFLVSPHLAPETFGLAVVEALSRARPVLASNIGGPSTILTEGTTGLLVPPGDDEALACAVRRLSESPESLLAMSRSARACYESQFTLEQHGRRLLDLFERTLSQASRGRAA